MSTPLALPHPLYRLLLLVVICSAPRPTAAYTEPSELNALITLRDNGR
jgi:hypothetical protein